MSPRLLCLPFFFLGMTSCAKTLSEAAQPVQVEIISIQPSSIIIQVEPDQGPLVIQIEPEPVSAPLISQVESEPVSGPLIVQIQFEPVPPPQSGQVQFEPVPPPQIAQIRPEPMQPLPTVIQREPESASPPPGGVTNLFHITQEQFEAAKTDIQKLVQDLNEIIRKGDYNTWLTYLGDEYRIRISSREFRNDLIERYPIYQGKINIGRDYFTYVVVPSRANDHVDDIEYVSENEVKAYTVDAKGQRVVLYFLEYRNGKWRIVN